MMNKSPPLTKHNSAETGLRRFSHAISLNPDKQKENQKEQEKEHSVPMPAAWELENNEQTIKVGWLFKRGGGKKSAAWKKRWFILTGQYVYYYKTAQDRKPKGYIGPLKEYFITPGEDDKKLSHFEFSLVPKSEKERKYVIYAISRGDKVDWMEVLEHATTGGSSTKQAVEIEEKLRRNCYDIPSNDLEWIVKPDGTDLLGKGVSGVVRKGKWLKTTEVAIKALNNLPEFTDNEEMIGFYKEIETLSQLRHPNIVPMFGYCKKDRYLCLVTEFVKGGNLSESIYNPSIKIIDELVLKVDLCMSISRGMVYLHNKNVIHRDLKPGNILVENLEEARVKVCDFGLSTITKGGKEENEMTSTTYGSPAYAAPELPTENHTNKVDVFSFAVIMWEICTRSPPWNKLDHSWQISEAINKGERLPLNPGNPLNSLISDCWKKNPDSRPNFSQIYEKLEALRTTLPSMAKNDKKRTSSFNSPINGSEQKLNEPKVTMETQLLQLFGDNEYMVWDDLAKSMLTLFNSQNESIQKLKFSLVDENENVSQNDFKRFLEWFSPLVEPDFYENNSNNIHQFGYQLEEIADIVGPSWFYAFLSAQRAKEILNKMSVGAYLFRFSSNPGCYAISVNYGQVGHWRITTEKSDSSYPIFRIDGRPYKSLHHIIETHQLGGEPLQIKSSGGTRQCFLKEAADRNITEKKKSERLYEAMY